MEALVEILIAIAAFIIEMTLHSLVFIFLIFMAIFSPRYRRKLADEWDTSNWQRVGIVLGVAVYSVVLVGMLIFWTHISVVKKNSLDAGNHNRSTVIEFTSKELENLKQTKELDQLVDAAGDIIKRKIAERKVEKEQETGADK